MRMRMFVAAVPPAGACDDLEEFLAPRRDDPDFGAGFRWVLPEHWHLTLAFCADVPERVLDDFVERLGRAAHRRTAATVRIAGGGAFPHPGKAKVLWSGLETDGAEELRRLSVGARAAATKAGIDVDGQRFRAHLTLGRTGHPVEATRWLRVLDAYRGPTWQLDRIALIESHLGEGPRRRPRYETVAELPLQRPR